MAKLDARAEEILIERFGGDSIISLATVEGGAPHVRSINAVYDSGAFYAITYGLSNKMRHIAKNPAVAICGDWFTAHGTARNMGYFGKPENAAIAAKLKDAFAVWIDNGHTDFSDENTCIVKIELTDGILFSHGTRFDIEF